MKNPRRLLILACAFPVMVFASTPSNQAAFQGNASSEKAGGALSGIDRLGAGRFINEVTGQAAFKVDLGGINNFNGISHTFGLAYFGGGLAEFKETPERLKPTSWVGLGFALETPRIFRAQPRMGLILDDDFRLEMGGGLSGRLVKYEPNKFVLENHPEIKIERVTHTGQATAVYIVPTTPRQGPPGVDNEVYTLTKIRHWVLTMPNGVKYHFGESPANFTCSSSEFCLPVLRDRIAFQTLYNTDQSRMPVTWYLRQIIDNQAKFSIWFDYDKRQETVHGSLVDRMIYPLEASSSNGTVYPATNADKIGRVQFITEARSPGQSADGRFFDPLCEIDDLRLKEARFFINNAPTHSLSFQYGSTANGHLRLEKIFKHSLRESVKRPYYTFTYAPGTTSWRLATVADIIGLETHFTYGTTAVTHNQGNSNYPSISTSSAFLSTAPLFGNPYISFSRQVGNSLYICVQDRLANDGPDSFVDLYKFENKGNYWERQWQKLLTPVPDGWSPNINALRVTMPADGSYILASYEGHPPPPAEQTPAEKTVLLFWDLRNGEPASPQIVTTERSGFFSESTQRIAPEIFPFDDWGVLRAGIVNRGFYRNSSGIWSIISVPAPYFNTEWEHDGLMAGPGYFLAYVVPEKTDMSLQTSTRFMIGKIIDGQMRTKYFHIMDNALDGPHGGGAWRILGLAPSEHYIAVAFGHMDNITNAGFNGCVNDWYADHNYSVAFFPLSELDLQLIPAAGPLPERPTWTEIIPDLPNKKYFFLANECNGIPDATQRSECRRTKINPTRFSIQASGNMVVISDPQAMKNVSVYFYDPITNTATAHERIISGSLDPAYHYPVTAGSNFFTVEKMEVDYYLQQFENAMKCGSFYDRAWTFKNFQENYKPLHYSMTRNAGSSHYPHQFDARMFEVSDGPPYSFTDVTPEITTISGSTSKRLGNISIVGNTFMGIEKVSANGSFTSDGYMLAARGRSGWTKTMVPFATTNNYFCSPLTSGMACFEYNGTAANGTVRFFDAYNNGFNVGSMDVVSRVTVKSRGLASGPADTRNLDFAYGTSSSYSGQTKLPAFGELAISDDFGTVKRTFKLDPNHSPLTDQNRIMTGLEIATLALPDKNRTLTTSAGGTSVAREFFSRQAAGAFAWPVYSLELPWETSKTHFFSSWQEGKSFQTDYDPANGQPRVSVTRNNQRIMVERRIFQHAPGGPLINGDYSKVRQAITYAFSLGEDPCTGPTANPCQPVTATFLDGKKSNAVASVATVFDAVSGASKQTYQWAPPSLPATIPDFSAGHAQWKLTSEVLRRSSANSVAIVKDDAPTETMVQNVRTLNYYAGMLARPIATVVNSTQLTCGLLNGEEQIFNPGSSWFGAFGEWEKGGSAIASEIAHTGRSSIKVTSPNGPAINLFPAYDNSFWSRKKGLVLSAWIYATGTYQGPDDSQPIISIEFWRDGLDNPIRTDFPVTQYRNEHGYLPYNRWVKVEAHIPYSDMVLISGSDDHLRIWLGKGGTASANPVYVDDVRIHPVDASVTTSNYDLIGRLASTLDGNNDPVYHEYDVWNRLIGTKDSEGRSFSFSSTKLINE